MAGRSLRYDAWTWQTPWLSIALAVACCSILCSDAGAAAPNSSAVYSGDAALKALATRYYSASWKFQPDFASATGVHDYDSQLGSFSPSDFTADNQRLRKTLAELDAVATDSLSLDGKIDKQILVDAVKERLFYRLDWPEWRLRPGFYNDIVSNAVFQLAARDFAPASERLRLVIAREQQVPGLLAQAIHNIDIPDVAPIVARYAAEDVDGTAAFFSVDLPKAFRSVHDPLLLSQFRASNGTAIRAVRGYAQFIRSKVAPNAHGGYALGLAHYQYLASLENAADVPVSTLLAAGKSALARDTANFNQAAKQFDPSGSVASAYAKLTRDHSSAQGLIPTAQQQLVDLALFIKAHHIIDLPSAPIAHVVPTPEFEASTTEASFDAPGPLERVATQALYNVTVPKHLSARELEEYLGEFNRHTLLIVSAHEIYPGHFTNYLFNKQAGLSLIRNIEWNSAFGEGWAHYGEQMMVDEGLGAGDPRYRMAQAKEALLRDCRLIVGIKEHTRGMTVDEATSFFMKHGRSSHSVALAEAVRGTTDPLYGHYTWGKLMLFKLRADYQKKMGPRYMLARFHDALLSHGDPPIAALRKLLLGPTENGALL